MTNRADKDLIELAQRGDKTAFEALLREYYDVMFRIAFKWCGNREDAQDITQNACIKLARSIDGFRFQSAFLTWLYPLVINSAKDWVKARANQPGDEMKEDTRVTPSVAEEKIYTAQILKQVGALPDKEKDALILVFSEGMSHREAAVIMKCKESTVSWYIHEARKKLQSFREKECRYG